MHFFIRGAILANEDFKRLRLSPERFARSRFFTNRRNQNMEKIRNRQDIPQEDKWAIEDLYPTDQAW